MASIAKELLKCLLVVAVLVQAFEALPAGHRRNQARRIQKRDVNDGFLPRNVIPTHYNLEVTPDIYTTPQPPFAFSGTVQIYVTCTEDTSTVVLNSFNLGIIGVDLRTDPANVVLPPSPVLLEWTLQPEGANFLTLTVANPLEAGYLYTITVYYTGHLVNGGVGLNWNSYVDSDGSTKYMVATNLQELGARQTFPCFDEPDLKATYNITILSQDPMTTLSNMPEISSERRGSYTAHHFDTTPKIPPYQVAIVVGELVAVPVEQNLVSYPITLYARQQVVGQLAFAASIVAPIQKWLEDQIGTPYPLPKLDHIAMPTESWETEGWGAVTYGETYFLIDEQYSGAAGLLRVARTVAHEIAHQWFCNLVTFKTYEDVWIREGFSQHYGYRALDSLSWPGREMQQADEVEGTLDFLNFDAINSSDPVRKPISTVWDAADAAAGSTYQKGGAIVRQLQGILTTPTFRTAIQNVVAKYAYGSITTEDLWTELSAQAAADGRPLDVGSVTDAWLNQWGYPLVFVSSNGDGTATAMPRQYFNPAGLTATTPSPYNYEWDIPVTVATQTTTDFDGGASQWIPHGVTNFTLNGIPTGADEWFLLNYNQQFFYRIDYDLANRANVVNQLTTDHTVIPTESRTQFIDDTFQLSETMNTLSSTAMDTSLYLAQETEYGPWHVGLKHLRVYDRLLQDYLWYTSFKNYMASLVLPLYQTLGWDYPTSDHPFQQYLRRDILVNACYYGLGDCLTEAKREYDLFKADPTTSAVDPNNLPTVLCTGVSAGNSGDWSFVFSQYQARIQSPIREERFAYLFAMACSSDTAWLDRYLSYITTTSLIADRDKDPALFYLTQSRAGLPIVRDYLYNTWSNVPETIHKIDRLGDATAPLKTLADAQDFNTFVGLYPPSNTEEKDHLLQIGTHIVQNADWIESNEYEMQNWLENHSPIPPSKRAVFDMRKQLPISPMAFSSYLQKY